MRVGPVVALAAVLAAVLTAAPSAQPQLESREVRQLVTFRFLPGQGALIHDIYRSSLVPAYREIEAMRTVRVFAEVESPEPMDLMVVTHYADMAAMDRANQDLRNPAPDRQNILELYGQISNLTLGHRDEFVELVSPPNFAQPTDNTLEVLEFFRVSPGSANAFERQVLAALHPWEQEQPIRDVVLRSETARFLVADGWDYLRTYSMRNLAAWQTYLTARAKNPAAFSLSRFVEARKTVILREVPMLRVR